MWNYNFVMPSLAILLILLVYYCSRPQVSIRINRTFIMLLLIDFLVIIFDILSSEVDSNAQNVPLLVLKLLNYLYFAFFIARSFLFCQYTVNILHLQFHKLKGIKVVFGSVFVLAELITFMSLFTGDVFYFDAAGYHSGPFYNIIYVNFVFYIFLSLLLLWFYSERLSRYELISAIAYNLILLVGNIVRFLMPQYLVMNTFCLMAILIIYLTFQNPDLYMSDRGPTLNRKAFRIMLEETKDRGSFRVLAFVLRNYNDEREIYGYHQMDQGITLISEFLAETFPKDHVFYLRNGCFALLGDNTLDWTGIQETIQKRFQKPWRADEADLFLNVGFVRISSDANHEEIDTILDRLLAAFSEAGKKIGGTGALIDLDQIHEVDHNVDIKRALEHAIETDQVEIYLQPLIESVSGSMIGAEVLARITNEEGRVLSPALFIPIAEQNGQINRLGAQVFEKACRFISEGNLDKTGLSWLNVNLSPIQCMKKDISSEFSEILNKYNVHADQIHLEITEASMIDLSLLQKQITTLKTNGFQFALDDYGSGYSNLTRVKHYPFINIKLDMEVVWDYFREKDVLLPAIVQAFKQLHLSITAEGIETKEMAEAMKDIGCDFLQGFYFSKPLPIPEFVEKYGK